ncbi:hypothetical protein N0V90_012392 [Kalmusia sp. IMI 367209]|nr:hypothetical protein N0V90_012392 [Kalmusia sp. IMI 367209]
MKLSTSTFTTLYLLANTVTASIPSKQGYDIVFSDDFNGAKGAPADHSKWKLRWNAPDPNNGEVQQYRNTTANSHLSGDGQLYILPTKEDGKWYSARLESWHASSCDKGKTMIFQSQIWVPDFNGHPKKHDGVWPAFWALGETIRTGNPWPYCGEWDIMETSNRRGNLNNAVLHFASHLGCANPRDCHQASPSKDTPYEGGKYHTWSFKVDRTNSDWQAQSMTWYLDGQQIHQVFGRDTKGWDRWDYLASRKYFMVLNVALGGGFGGAVSSSTVSGYDNSMRVRYAAIYKSK